MASVPGSPNGIVHRTSIAKELGEMVVEREGPVDPEFGESLPPASGEKGGQEEAKEGRGQGGAWLGAMCFFGIFFSYFIYALLQEKM